MYCPGGHKDQRRGYGLPALWIDIRPLFTREGDLFPRSFYYSNLILQDQIAAQEIPGHHPAYNDAFGNEERERLIRRRVMFERD